MHPAIENLKVQQRQLDEDGVEVGVSRQALDETLAEIDRIETERFKYESCLMMISEMYPQAAILSKAALTK